MEESLTVGFTSFTKGIVYAVIEPVCPAVPGNLFKTVWSDIPYETVGIRPPETMLFHPPFVLFMEYLVAFDYNGYDTTTFFLFLPFFSALILGILLMAAK